MCQRGWRCSAGCLWRGKGSLPGLDAHTALGALSQPGQRSPGKGSCARAEPPTGTAAPAGASAVPSPLLSRNESELSLGETSLGFIGERIKMKHGGFPCSVVGSEQTEVTAAVLW